MQKDGWNADGTKTAKVAKQIIQQFKIKFPKLVRRLNIQSFNEIENKPKKCRPLQCIKACTTLAKRQARREANKHKIEEKDRKWNLYIRYKRLRTTNSKRSFNRQNNMYGLGKTKGPKFDEFNVGSWKQEKQDAYTSGKNGNTSSKERV